MVGRLITDVGRMKGTSAPGRPWPTVGPVPDLDPADLEQAIYEAQGDLSRPEVLDAISHTVSAAIWLGQTTGYLTLTGRYTIPRKFLTHCHAALPAFAV